ncbi:MAG: phosphoribosylamine--glycine ligase [Actinomycetaceae bacterium]|nr:phosphoribosylamine--glycine ligase [Actinomycetaceae bacterium]
MKILLLGSGGREHAIARALSQDPELSELLIAPGNPATAALGTNIELDILDPEAVAAVAQREQVDLVVVGPEAPLVAGVADAVREAGIAVFGPGGQAAQLEGSKAFAKEVMQLAGVPTAEARVCTTLDEAAAALDEFGAPHVVKDDGLAGGKGVVVTSDRAEALAHAEACLAKPDGQIVIEDYLDGPEVSLFCVCDGVNVLPLEPAQDFKRAYDGDEGLNTGGMGAYSPLPWAPADLSKEVVETVARPVVDEMARRGTPFIGLLYCGLALTSRGLRVVEFNVRFGDPETQSVLARLRTPLAQLLYAAAIGELPDQLEWSDEAAVTVVLAASGYPASPKLGDPITGLDEAEQVEGAHVIHAGTALKDGELVSAGGRVLATVGLGKDIDAARARAYEAMSHIKLDGSHHRSDIAANVARLQAGQADQQTG